METFKEYAAYYDVFYQSKNYKKEAEEIDYLLRKYGENIHKLIDFGCGTGKHDIELAKKGYQCEGIDVSTSMIDMARKSTAAEGTDIKFIVGDIQQFIPNQKYDAVISLFHVMSYQIENHGMINAFKSARRSLNAGGIFLFDVWYGSGVLSDKPAVRVREAEDGEKKFIRIAKPAMYERQNLVQINYDIYVIDKRTNIVKKIQETHDMRYFFRPEIELMLHMSDFEIVDNFDCATLGETSFDSWTSYFVAKAI